MTRMNKYEYLWVVQGYYAQGWEDLTESEDFKEARSDLKAYRVNELGILHRLIQRRVLRNVGAVPAE